ncbi:MAG: MBL fold metallo-hydrolase [Acidobacteriota bacterium]
MSDPVAYSVHLLDMGLEMYGDSILVQGAGKIILIDGGHRADWQQRSPDTPALPTQLRTLLGLANDEPIHVDLLVVTHCHADHIGCLPKLVEDGDLKADWALVADPDLGTGRIGGGDALRGMVLPERNLIAALVEEDRSRLSDAALREFIADAATQDQRYRAMIQALIDQKARVHLYTQPSDAKPVEAAFRALGLRVVGPTKEHLIICARALAAFQTNARDTLSRRPNADTDDLVSAYRDAVSVSTDSLEGADSPGKGAALNNQSLVMTIGGDGQRSLLAGDMQFAKPEIAGLGPAMRTLRGLLAGEYSLVKLSHHASYNGFDESVLGEMRKTVYYTMSGGLQDAGHPDPGVLDLLHANRSAIKWTRTDRNGLIGIHVAPDGTVSWSKTRGQFNDSTPNGQDTFPEAAVVAPSISVTQVAPAVTPRVTVERTETEFVEAKISIPHRATKVTVTIEITPGDPLQAPVSPNPPDPPDPPPPRPPGPRPDLTGMLVAGGRALPKLLFVTQPAALAKSIGRAEAKEAITAVERVAALLNLDAGVSTLDAVGTVQENSAKFDGVVLLGGYDVVPSCVRDTIGDNLRALISPSAAQDEDSFVVWSDDDYGIQDNHRFARPVSRIPDGRSADLVRAALGANRAATPKARTGILNCMRPFAREVFERLLPGTDSAYVSEPHEARQLPADSLERDVLYFMLHGAYWDGRAFWGDRAVIGGQVEAITTSSVRKAAGAVVLSGACWGALVVKSPAGFMRAGEEVAPRTPEASIPLSLLLAGANAFVGSTGVHYSPLKAPYGYFGGPMHEYFWRFYIGGKAPALALCEAKRLYLKGIPFGPDNHDTRAIELKILDQFTCLGLGW